jgi:hypothetical protein
MATSEQLEREAKAARAQIAATLDELRGRMTPGHVVDELVDYARDSGGGEFVRNLGRQVVGNPLPVTLVGAGLAWLMMAGRRDGGDGAGAAFVGDRTAATAESVRDTAESLRDMSHDMGQATRDAASARVEGLTKRANAAGAAVHDTASSAYGAATEHSRQGADAVARGARSVRQSEAAGGQNIMSFLQEQPLMLAGIGLAVGALLGTSLPTTDVEDHLMGEASDATKRDAKAFADEQVDKGKAVAEQAWSAAKPEIEEQLHGAGQHAAGTEPPSEAGPRHEPGSEATLVPADETGQAEAVSDVARRETGHPSD